MSHRQRTVAKVGAFIWIPAVIFVFVVFAGTEPGEEPPPAETIASILFLLAMVVALAAVVLMIKHVYTESDLSEGWKTAWTAMLFFFNVLVAPFYWMKHMANEERGSGSET